MEKVNNIGPMELIMKEILKTDNKMVKANKYGAAATPMKEITKTI